MSAGCYSSEKYGVNDVVVSWTDDEDILTPAQVSPSTVPHKCQPPGVQAAGIPLFKYLVWLGRGSNPIPPTLQAYALPALDHRCGPAGR